MADQTAPIQSWPDLAIGLYDRLTERNAVIDYHFEDMTIQVPTEVGSQEKTAWKLNGKLRISTSEKQG